MGALFSGDTQMNEGAWTGPDYPGITAATAQIGEKAIQTENQNPWPDRTNRDIAR